MPKSSRIEAAAKESHFERDLHLLMSSRNAAKHNMGGKSRWKVTKTTATGEQLAGVILWENKGDSNSSRSSKPSWMSYWSNRVFTFC